MSCVGADNRFACSTKREHRVCRSEASFIGVVGVENPLTGSLGSVFRANRWRTRIDLEAASWWHCDRHKAKLRGNRRGDCLHFGLSSYQQQWR